MNIASTYRLSVALAIFALLASTAFSAPPAAPKPTRAQVLQIDHRRDPAVEIPARGTASHFCLARAGHSAG